MWTDWPSEDQVFGTTKKLTKMEADHWQFIMGKKAMAQQTKCWNCMKNSSRPHAVDITWWRLAIIITMLREQKMVPIVIMVRLMILQISSIPIVDDQMSNKYYKELRQEWIQIKWSYHLQAILYAHNFPLSGIPFQSTDWFNWKVVTPSLNLVYRHLPRYSFWLLEIM